MAEDIRLDEFGKVNEVTYLLGLDVSGNGKVITPSDLLADHMTYRGASGDVNNCKETGIYAINTDSNYSSNSPAKYGILVVFNGNHPGSAMGGIPILQLVLTHVNQLFLRLNWMGNWGGWRAI